MKRAFTMIELIFVIVVIGILASIAIPRFAATRDDAEITKAIATIGAIKSSVATERQKRAIRGDFDPITCIKCAGGGVFNTFSADNKWEYYIEKVLETPACKVALKPVALDGCWSVAGGDAGQCVLQCL